MASPQYETLTVELDGPVATVWLNRPERANSMNAQMWVDIDDCFTWLDAHAHTRAIVLSGRGKHFCAGIDLDMLSALRVSGERGRAGEQLRKTILRLQDNLTAIERCAKPVLAAIHSTCYGGGVDIISCADMRYCTPQARFAIKEIDVGLVADVGSLQRLPHIIGGGLVRELAYTGRDMFAEEAYAVRLVNKVFEDETTMLQGVQTIAHQIAAKTPLAIRGTKAALLYARDHTVSDGLDYAATWNSAMLSFDDVDTALAGSRTGDATFED
jgi:enoyl-CoA hydratase